MIEVKIKNIKQIRMAFLLSPKMMAKNLLKAIRQSAARVEYEAKLKTATKTTPVDTGRLRASIIFEGKGGYIFKKVRYGIEAMGVTEYEAVVSAHTDYADAVHEGTKYMRGRPFMVWAMERAGRHIDGYFAKALDNTLLGIKTKAR